MFPISPLRTNCVLFGSVTKSATLVTSTSDRTVCQRLKGRVSIIGNPAFASLSITMTVRLIYAFESSAKPTKTGIIEIRKRLNAKNTPKNVISMPRTSGIFQCFNLTTKGPRRRAKKQKKKKSQTKSLKI